MSFVILSCSRLYFQLLSKHPEHLWTNAHFLNTNFTTIKKWEWDISRPSCTSLIEFLKKLNFIQFMNHLSIYRKINQLPITLIAEIEDYIDFLLQKYQNVQLPKISKAESVQNIPPDLANELIVEKRQEIKSVQAKPLIIQIQ